MRRTLLALLSTAWLTACGSSPPPATTQPDPVVPATWHKDIAPLVQQKCGGCHVDGGAAPFPLQTYPQAFESRRAIRASVKARLMPPWPASSECAEYKHDRSLSTEQIDLISRWVDEGGAEGNPADAPPQQIAQSAGLSRVDVTLEMPEAYTPRTRPDDYRCFIIDWPYADVRYVTGFRGNPGNKALVHHVIGFLASPSDLATYQALDDKEPGPGYTCFGGPGVNDARAQWVGAWVPGNNGTEVPAGTGIRIEPGSKIVLQIHYNTGSSAPVPDRTSLSFKLDTAVQTRAFVIPWANPQWLQAGGMRIPAGSSDTVYRFPYELTAAVSQLTNGVLQNGKPVTIHGAGLHMHTRGVSARTDIWRGGSADKKDCVLNIPAWDFHWQGQYMLTQAKTVNPGDVLAVECRWNNSGANAKDIYWGEGTGDEMCLGTYYITQ
jgi:mono/diheme cytochrome c family protein